MSFTALDYRFMARALRLAAKGARTTHPNPRVGCVITRDCEVVGEAWHERAGLPHAEVLALEAAGEAARGATAYVTLEPCAHHGRTGPCAEALALAGVNRVVAATQDPDPRVAGQGFAYLRESGIRVQSGLLADNAESLNRGFFHRLRQGRPWVTVKLAASLDGRTALANGESRWISGEAARDDVHRLRAEASAVLTGSGTVLADDPRLTARLEDVTRQPLRVVLDSRLRTPPTSRLLAEEDGSVRIYCGAEAGSCEALEAAGARVTAFSGPRPDPAGVLRGLAEEEECNEVLVEAGPGLSGSLLCADLVDEVVLYLAPHLIGDAGQGLFHLPGLESMDQRRPLKIRDLRRIGEDIRLTLQPESREP